MPRTAVLDGLILGLFRGVVRGTNVEPGTSIGRVPDVGCPNLGICPDSSQTRGSVPIAAGPSTWCVPNLGSALAAARGERTVQTRCSSRNAFAFQSSNVMCVSPESGHTRSKFESRACQRGVVPPLGTKSVAEGVTREGDGAASRYGSCLPINCEFANCRAPSTSTAKAPPLQVKLPRPCVS